jgi:CHAD domain-containing protein
MSYRMQDQEAVPDGVKRLVLEQIDEALGGMKARRGNRDEAIHNARTCLKKIRAVLRLVRDDLGDEVFRRENLCFRDAGRLLSGVRDATVVLETFDALLERYAAQLTADGLVNVRKRLRQSNAARPDEKRKALSAAAKMIAAAGRRAGQWPLEHDDFAALGPGLERAYRRGRRGLAQATEQPSVESFHEWRKQVKCLWYQIRLLKPLWPGVLEPLAAEFKALGEYLSDDHDLAILRERLLGQAEHLGDRTAIEALVALIDQRRGELQTEAKLLGARLYAEKPGAFVGRLQAYWRAWRAEVEAAPTAVG